MKRVVTVGLSCRGQISQFDHACENCTFLGRHEYMAPVLGGGAKHVKVDLYVCEHPTGRTYVARYGDEPSNYASYGEEYVEKFNPRAWTGMSTFSLALLEALLRWESLP